MKKTLVALTVAAFASSASAFTVYENTDTKVEFDGSVRLLLEQNSSKTKNGNGLVTEQKRAHTNLHDDGTRFQVKVKHNLADDFFALGRLEFRFNGSPDGTDKFGELYAHRAYVGLGSKAFGELTFGRQDTIAGDILQSGFNNKYNKFEGLMTDSGTAVVRYDYKGIEGLQVGVDYRFAEKRDDKGEVSPDGLKAGYGVGAVYTLNVAEGQELTVASGYTRDHFKVDTNKKHHKDAWGAGAKYVFNDLSVALDYVGSFESKANDTKERKNGLRAGVKYQVTPKVAVYSVYGYGVGKEKTAGVTTKKGNQHDFTLGSSYQLSKNVFTYLDAGVTKTTTKNGRNVTQTKVLEKNVGVGLRVSW